ncbi:GtrA family protein [Candidatus Nomurabacteria bacterium]|nr:GtrA family protein [Candidatus Nomurabacteria bacterium]
MILSQVIIIVFMFLTVNLLGLNEKISYATILTLIYAGAYLSYTKYVFKTDHSKKRLFRFIQILIFSWFSNNGMFFVFTEIAHLHYILATIGNTLVLGSVRFLLNKYYVFEKE